VAFDMARQLGRKKSAKRAARIKALHDVLSKLAWRLRPTLNQSISKRCLNRHRMRITKIFDELARYGGVVPTQRFVVGATKVLHFLNPKLFLIIDKRVAGSLREIQSTLPRDPTAYSGARYFEALGVVHDHLRRFGITRMRRLDRGSPLLRTVDKVLFIPK
jgi:hypothetical protein